MDAPDRYRTIRRIGIGGMAEIFEAVATGSGGFQRRVAIKRMIADAGGDDSLTGMFLDEARIASHFHHGNVVSVLDYGVVGGVPFQVLEYVDGTDAERLLRLSARNGQAFPTDIALHVCTEVSHALSHVHSIRDGDGRPLSIVHRDVKPSNILVSWGGDVKLTDFGIALSKVKRHATTQVGMVKGTPLYMAPEQMSGGTVDGRADVFALGCVLHALLLGESPMQLDRVADLIAGHEIPLSDALDADVREILSRSLRVSKANRFATSEEMTSQLGAALSKRLDRDAKTRMREWLSPFHDAVAPLREQSGDGVHFEILPTAVAQRSFSAPRPSQGTTVKHGTPAQVIAPPPRQARWLFAGMSVAAVLAAAGVALFALDQQSHVAAPVEHAAAEPAAAPDLAPIRDVESPPETTTTTAAVAAPRPAPAPPALEPVEIQHKARPSHIRKKARVEPTPAELHSAEPPAPVAVAATVQPAPAAAAPPPVRAPGSLRLKVSGEGTAKVMIDDLGRGNLPYDNTFALPAGVHRLRLERFGQVLEEHSVTIEDGQVTVIPIQFGNR